MGNYSGVGRVTWAASSKDKIRVYVEKQFNGEFYNGFNTLPTIDARGVDRRVGQRLGAAGAVDARAVEQAAVRSRHRLVQPAVRAGLHDAGLPATALPSLNGSTGLLTGKCGYTIPPYSSTTKDYNVMASASYITGSHAMKFGMTDLWGENSRTFAPAANIDTLDHRSTSPVCGNEIPFQVVVYNSPATSIQNVNSDFGSYAQDTWTMKRLTLNYGARFEHFNASVPAESSPASTWIGARNFPAIPERAELERLGGPLRGRVRPVRQRQDRDQGERRQVRRRAGGRLSRRRSTA